MWRLAAAGFGQWLHGPITGCMSWISETRLRLRPSRSLRGGEAFEQTTHRLRHFPPWSQIECCRHSCFLRLLDMWQKFQQRRPETPQEREGTTSRIRPTPQALLRTCRRLLPQERRGRNRWLHPSKTIGIPADPRFSVRKEPFPRVGGHAASHNGKSTSRPCFHHANRLLGRLLVKASGAHVTDVVKIHL